MKFKPLGNYVLVETIEISNVLPSGLALPETSKERPNQGKVIATGDGTYTEAGSVIPVQTHLGDTILFQKFAGLEIKLDGRKFLLIRDTDILGILSE